MSICPIWSDASRSVESRPNSIGPKSRNSWKAPREPWHDWESFNAKPAVLIRPADRAHFWSLTDGPATPRVTATLHLRVLAREVPSTAAPDQSRETCPNPLVNAAGSIWACHETTRTCAHVAACCVGTLTTITHAGDCSTLIHIFASVAGLTLLVSCRAFALIRTYCVDAVTSLTEARNGLTFIHILAGSSANVGNETSAAGMRLGRAHLTWVTPGPSNGGTTHGLGTDNPTELALAHLVIYLAKAGTGTIVSLTLGASEPVDTSTTVWSNATTSILTAVFTDRLSTVCSGITFLAEARFLIAASTIHAPHIAGLDSS